MDEREREVENEKALENNQQDEYEKGKHAKYIEKQNMKQKHTGGSIKKFKHLDLDITLNQTEMEKRAGKMRFQILVNRHEEGIEKGEVVVLQSLKLGQTLIDSEWKKDKRKVEE